MGSSSWSYTCFGKRFDSLTALIQYYDQWQWSELVMPYIERLNSFLPQCVSRFEVIRHSFLGKPPIWSEDETSSEFYTQSSRREVRASVRRFSLGSQGRGTHMSLRSTTNMVQHVQVALDARHPNQLIHEVLEPPWRYVFD